MLVAVTENQPKIAMGLMSYIDDFATYTDVQREIQWYHANQHRQLLLWKDPMTRHMTAVIGIEEIGKCVLVRLIAFGSEIVPYEQQLVGGEIYGALQNYYPKAFIMGTIRTQAILRQWEAYQTKNLN
ncbi:hypothetical protein ACJQWY_01940 [Weissella kandleri]|uniref:hypothetical protein n=1 Tax=Weissella kandleri TaxID=1616 RepID=UPI00387EC779